jgi:myo-inositol-1(or 4)-monophosphatase
VWSDGAVNDRRASIITSPPGEPASDDPATLRRIAEHVVTEAAAHLHTLPRPWEQRTDRSAAPAGVSTKSTPTDVVTASDTALEALVRERLSQLRPGDPVVGEEGGGTAVDGVVTWVVDPIDGTVNFLYGLPWYAVSLAATRDGVSLAGAVAEPASGRLWSAARGAGATCDGRPLRSSAETDLAMTMVGTGFAYSPQRRARQAAFLGGMLPQVRDLRRSGSSALDVCSVAAGWLDAYLEHGPHWWDWAAAALIAEEAGAVVRVPARPGSPAPDDGLGPDVLLVAAPGVAAGLAGLAAELGAAQI